MLSLKPIGESSLGYAYFLGVFLSFAGLWFEGASLQPCLRIVPSASLLLPSLCLSLHETVLFSITPVRLD